MIEWITCHLLFLVAGLSVVREIWQDPPPWTALPMKLKVWFTPIGMTLFWPWASKATS